MQTVIGTPLSECYISGPIRRPEPVQPAAFGVLSPSGEVPLVELFDHSITRFTSDPEKTARIFTGRLVGQKPKKPEAEARPRGYRGAHRRAAVESRKALAALRPSVVAL